ncbi:Glu/Leu/Phe/Val family dehydrogenase [Sulfitobacter sabulilitoris]|uniref:Glutamate dehydrogenase n=1 Tax=Sulfitobacter sabulilitoris TaxID=2562655 RepID=A0A5S3PKY8_9RHOB|nr:Glu/Leu/Phe/Val dehydrogenase [Sulfitobacter sabulilitoris]TMM54220.1 Glu/Leu/Phe/Val dehydrogenase [Sulfitobacter sabulilitoris]
MTDPFALADGLGPEKIVHLHDAAVGLRAIVVIDNTAAGPSIGGVRMADDASLGECARLARAMTFKNAAAGLPHGGGKSVILGNPAMAGKERLVRAFARAIAELGGYIPGPDMGTDETAMAWVHDEIGRAVGLPRVLGGIPLDQIGITGFGLGVAADAAQAFCGLRLDGASVAIQGFGSVGMNAATALAGMGARLVAVSDSGGSITHPKGLPIDDLIALKRASRSVTALAGATALAGEATITAQCDILVPAARPDVITQANARDVKARLVLEGANIPTSAAAERILHDRDVLVVPDFIANAGGVICASVEYRGGTESDARAAVTEKIRANTVEVLARARDTGAMPREAAQAMALARIHEAMSYGRFTGA